MQFNSNVIKATLFSLLATASSVAMANQHGYKPVPTPTPYCPPTPPAPSAVPEPSAWVAYAIGVSAIVALTMFNKAKAAKINN